MLRSLDMYLEFNSVLAQLWRCFYFALDFVSENLFIVLLELKMNPSNFSKTPSD